MAVEVVVLDRCAATDFVVRGRIVAAGAATCLLHAHPSGVVEIALRGQPAAADAAQLVRVVPRQARLRAQPQVQPMIVQILQKWLSDIPATIYNNCAPAPSYPHLAGIAVVYTGPANALIF